MKLEFPLPYDALKLGRNLRNSIEAIFLGEKYIFRRNNEDFSRNNVVSLFGINHGHIDSSGMLANKKD